MKTPSSILLTATASFGLEAVVARELRSLGYGDSRTIDGRVTFEGDLSAVCRSNLWLRSADRVLLQVGDFEATDFGALFDQTEALPWSDWLPADAKFDVRGKSVRSVLRSVPDCQRLVKKAIAVSLQRSHGLDWCPETGASFPIEVSLLKDRVTLSIDTTGPGLHKRGYRTHTGPAPLRETLAAALVQLSHWRDDRPLLDPVCGTGTIAIEAAMIGASLAPGRKRSFLAESWPWVPETLWTAAREEADDLAKTEPKLNIVGSDIDPKSIAQAQVHAEQAGVGGTISFECRDVAKLSSHRKYGCLIGNPPYGERMGDVEAAETVTRHLGRAFGKLETWSKYLLTAQSNLESLLGLRATRRRKLYNGRISCTYFQFVGPRPPWFRPPQHDNE